MIVRRGLSTCVARLKDRTVVRISGADAEKYVQDLATNDVRKLATEGSATQFAAFLTPRGRMICDAFVSRSSARLALASRDGETPPPTFLVDVGRSRIDELLPHLRHPLRLRGDVNVESVDADFGVWALLDRDGGGEVPLAQTVAAAHAACAGAGATEGGCVAIDARAAHCGHRAVLPLGGGGALAIDGGSAEEEEEEEARARARATYNSARVLAGAVEGEEVAGLIPLEANFAELGGIAFDKGCYLGQELIARTFHRGVVRKRCVPIAIGDAATAAAATAAAVERPLGVDGLAWRSLDAAPLAVAGDAVCVASSGAKAGKIVAIVPGTNLAIAMLRLKRAALEDPRDEEASTWAPAELTVGDVAARALQPAWWGERARSSSEE